MTPIEARVDTHEAVCDQRVTVVVLAVNLELDHHLLKVLDLPLVLGLLSA